MQKSNYLKATQKLKKIKHNFFASKIIQNMRTHGFPLSFEKIQLYRKLP